MPEEPTFNTEAESLAAICLVFGLRHNEGRMLMSLMTHNFRTHDQLRAVIAQEVVSSSTMSVTLFTLRKKLKPRGIKITNISKIGYMIDTRSRDRIHGLLAAHDAAIIPMRLKPETVEPDVCA
jgi:DNA-binding winged helix-turn-helix (wHTH) protein